ncbi:MAG: alcohol dehydrogenase catalytic domain-containing protein [Myxococcota bacterium]
MRAVRARAGKVEVVDVEPPRHEGIDVTIRSAGICGSDLHLVAQGLEGVTLGHEMAGTTPDGTPVAIEPVRPCDACPACRAGDYNLCALGPTIVIGTSHDGGMAETIRVPERCLVPLARHVRVEDACLVEPLAVAVHGLRRARLRGDERVCVIGGGSIGLCAIAAVRAAGAPVDLVARHDAQRAAGARLGAGEPSDGYDLVIDAAGTPAALEDAVARARPGARLLLLATYWDGLALPGFALCLKEVRVIPASMYGRDGVARDVDVAAGVLARSELADAIITHRFPLEAAPEAFGTAADRASGAIKVVLEP